jgi:hypothetical protein
MSAAFTAALKALSENPALHAKVISASSPEERAAHFRDAGVAVPTHEDVNSYLASMGDVDGGNMTNEAASIYAPVLAGGAAASSGGAPT